MAFLNGTLVDERAIRVDLDWGFVEGRQYGRGRSGGQVGRGHICSGWRRRARVCSGPVLGYWVWCCFQLEDGGVHDGGMSTAARGRNAAAWV